MGADEIVSAHDFYARSRPELEEFVRPKSFRILLLTFLLYPVSFLFFGKWAHLKRWSIFGWLYLAPLASFFALATVSAIVHPVGHDSYREIGVFMGLAITILWPIALVHTYKIRLKYTVLSASQDQLLKWQEMIEQKRAQEKRWEEEFEEQKRKRQEEELQRKAKMREEDESQRRIWREIQRERQQEQDRKRQEKSNSEQVNQRQKESPNQSQSHCDQRWDSNDPFVILGVAKGTGDKEVHKAWRKLMTIWHPDKAGTTNPKIAELHKLRTQKLNWARSQCERTSRRAA